MFTIVPTPEFSKDLEDFALPAITAIQNAVQSYLRTSPHIPQGTRIKKLHHFRPPLYRLRAGDYRVYYRLQETQVILLAVLNRRDAERWLSKYGD